jgi:putative DNA methylase
MSGVPIDSQFHTEFADSMARLESYNKHLYRPNSYLHKWWARRCGSTFRLILKTLVENPGQRDYYSPGGLAGKIILDPMMGGGTTLHEAIRLGANVIGADLDPIPVLQARATLTTLPPAELESAFDSLWHALRAELAPLFLTACPTCKRPTELKFTLYGVRRACQCGPAILIDSFILRHESDNSAIRICPRCHAIARSNAPCGCSAGEARLPLVEKGSRKCTTCQSPYLEESETPYYARYEPLAVVGECSEHGLFFSRPSAADLARLKETDEARPSFPVAKFAVKVGPKSADLLRRKISSYPDLFSSRQLFYLQRAIALIPSFEPTVQLNLALLISTSLEFNSMLCGYKGGSKRRPGAIRHTFAHHAYSFPYTALENNPLYPKKASGTLQKLFHDRIRRARRWAAEPRERVIREGRPHQTVAIKGEVDAGEEVNDPADLEQESSRFLLIQGSSASLKLETGSVDAVVTDPPYYDNVQYSDLAAFFRVWLRQMLPHAANWEVDLAESAVNPQASDGNQYTEVLGQVFSECHRVLNKGHGRLFLTFHHWNPKGWAALTLALKRANFVLLNRHVVHAENPVSVHIAKLKALIHDAILVLAPVETGARQVWPQPRTVDKSDSFRFCQDCASVLGWMLASDLGEAEIEKSWLELLEPAG